MSTSSYWTTDEMAIAWKRFVQTGGFAPAELDQHISDAEDEVNGAIGGRYTVPFSGGAPPLIRTCTRLLAGFNFLRGQIINEQPSRSDWVDRLREQAKEYLDKVAEGKLTLMSGSGTVIDPVAQPGLRIWSSTKDYVPTFGVIPQTRQEIDQDRIDDEDDARD